MNKLASMNPKVAVSLFVALILVITSIVGVSTYNSARNGVIQREAALSAQYLDNQNQLSAYIRTVKESLGIANTAAEAVDEIIGSAIKGRYAGGEGGNGSTNEVQLMINAVAEAYPNLDTTVANYANVQAAVSGGREAFKNQQTKLLDMLREYDTWRESGLIHSAFVSMVGAPTDRLVAQVGDTQVTGEEALKKMREIVLDEKSLEAFATGKDAGVDTGNQKFGGDKE